MLVTGENALDGSMSCKIELCADQWTSKDADRSDQTRSILPLLRKHRAQTAARISLSVDL